MKLAITLKYMFPDAVPMVDFIVQDDGQGAYIKEWNLTDAQPTQTEIEDTWPATQIWLNKKEIKRQLLETDNDMPRILEDLMSVDFDLEQLPQAAKDKFNNRKALREQLNG